MTARAAIDFVSTKFCQRTDGFMVPPFVNSDVSTKWTRYHAADSGSGILDQWPDGW